MEYTDLCINGGMNVLMEILQRSLQISTLSARAGAMALPEAGSLVQCSLPAARQRCPEGSLPVWGLAGALQHCRNLLKEILLEVLHAFTYLHQKACIASWDIRYAR